MRELHQELERVSKQLASTAESESALAANSDANAETIIVKADTSATLLQAGKEIRSFLQHERRDGERIFLRRAGGSR